MLAAFPALAAVVAIWGFFADPAVVTDFAALSRRYLPAEAFDIVAAQLETLVSADASRFGWTAALTLGVALWSARTGVAAIMQGLNAVFGLSNRGGLRQQLVAMLLTLCLIAAALTALATGIVAPIVVALVPLGPFEAWSLTVLRWSVAPLTTVLAIGVFYRYGPNFPADRPPLLSPGLGVAAALWLMGSEAFALYLGNFGSYNQIYGSIGAVVALLVWFYLSAYAVLLGAAVNAALRDAARVQ
jgi:membrane protein